MWRNFVTHSTLLRLSSVPLSAYYLFSFLAIDLAPYYFKLKVKTLSGWMQKSNETLIRENHTFSEIEKIETYDRSLFGL